MNDIKIIYDAIQASKGGTGYVVPDGAVDLGLPILFAEKMYGASEIGGLGTMGTTAGNSRRIYVNNETINISPWRIPTVSELKQLQSAIEEKGIEVRDNKGIISLNGNELIIPVNVNFYAIDLSQGGQYCTIWRIDPNQRLLTIGEDEFYDNYLLFVCDPVDWNTRWDNL